ncbi:MAG: triose-phosphate isomerase [Candidatus Limnocylindrales bacterium]
MIRPLVGTSWKMNLTPSRAAVYCAALRSLVADVDDRTLFVLPPFPSLPCARDLLAGSNVAWGAQDVHPDVEGAHTGDVSASMLADLGCTFVEVGHHERRRDHHEDDDLIASKVAAIHHWGMTAILCVGEEHRTTPEAARAHVLGQLRFVEDFDPARLVVAYEPAWAIGVGAERAPSEWIGAMHEAIHERLAEAAGGRAAIAVIYGGSVDAAGAREILASPGVDGLFVGRYALTAEGFAEIAHTPLRPER